MKKHINSFFLFSLIMNHFRCILVNSNTFDIVLNMDWSLILIKKDSMRKVKMESKFDFKEDKVNITIIDSKEY